MEQEQEEPTWQELMGTKNWENLLAPTLNLSLRKLILRCGDFSQANYDAFNNDTNSPFCGTSRYGPRQFFQKVCLKNGADYQVVTFLYATARVTVPEAFLLRSLSREAWDRESNWIGYVAVTTDEVSERLGRREIYVAWRGTTRNYEWVDDFYLDLASLKPLLKTKVTASTSKGGGSSSSSSSDDEENEKMPKVMRGSLTIYTSDDPNSPFTKTSVRTQLLATIKDLVTQYKSENLSITLTGHSLGGSLSTLSAFDIAENIENISNIPISAFVFCSPQVGNKAFNEKLELLGNVHVLHIRNTHDLVPHYPSILLGYGYTGTELVIDTRKSPSLKDSINPGDWHNLQAVLHIVAGWNGKENEFEFRVKRCLALVNKSCEFLKDECLVPGSWWVEKNKGMVLHEDGEWGLTPPGDEDLPVPPTYSLNSQQKGWFMGNVRDTNKDKKHTSTSGAHVGSANKVCACLMSFWVSVVGVCSSFHG